MNRQKIREMGHWTFRSKVAHRIFFLFYRSCKKGKAISEALQIMGAMSENGQIDPDLYDVFINKRNASSLFSSK